MNNSGYGALLGRCDLPVDNGNFVNEDNIVVYSSSENTKNDNAWRRALVFVATLSVIFIGTIAISTQNFSKGGVFSCII
jgi:hypothetical protein